MLGTEELRPLIERRTTVYMWGQRHWVVPQLVDEVFGDGQQLIRLAPLETRPNYYVVRIDSSWKLNNHSTEGPLLIDQLYEAGIYESIMLQFGEITEEDGDADAMKLWPALPLGGSEWASEPWPTPKKSKAAR